jgi:hypothetical protein
MIAMGKKGTNGLGRKPWVPDLEKVEELASRGLTNDQIAAALGISETTLYKSQRQLTQFSESIKKGRAKGIGQVANALFEAALDGNVQECRYARDAFRPS